MLAVAPSIYWKPRFAAGGYTALEQFASAAPKWPHRTDPSVEQQVIAMRQKHPECGKVRIAHELAKAHQWQPLVSPNTVKRILRSAGFWSAPAIPEKIGATTYSSTAVPRLPRPEAMPGFALENGENSVACQ
jgi:Homeodomain-like domain